MNDRMKYQLLQTLKNNQAYRELQNLWIEDVSDIEIKRDAVASKKNEDYWRYYAGLEKGYKKAIIRLDIELAKLEEAGNDPTQPSETIEKLLGELKK